MAELFDVSEDCYLNEPTKLPGRDYAWVNEFLLKQRIYNSLVSTAIMDSITMLRLESVFADERLLRI